MLETYISSKTKIINLAAAIAILGLGAIQAQGSVIYNFSDNTSDGWSNSGFGTSPIPAISNIGGVNYMYIPLGGFQVANVTSPSSTLPSFYPTMQAAAANPDGYNISYDYYINTAAFSGATFLHLGTFVNTGSGYYAQDIYGGQPFEVQLNSTQLASGQVFQGHVSINLATVGYAMPPADNFYRLGLIENGDGTGVGVYYTNISVDRVPEPATLSLLGLAAGAAFLRRRKA